MKICRSKKKRNTLFYEQKEFHYEYQNIKIVEDRHGNKLVERLDGTEVYSKVPGELKFEDKIKPPKMNLRRAGDVKK